MKANPFLTMDGLDIEEETVGQCQRCNKSNITLYEFGPENNRKKWCYECSEWWNKQLSKLIKEAEDADPFKGLDSVYVEEKGKPETRRKVYFNWNTLR